MFGSLIRLSSVHSADRRLSIFIYHRVLPAPDLLFPDEVDLVRFEQQIGWITRWFRVLPLSTAVSMLQDGRLPAGAAAITFDDGYADNLRYAAPVLHKYGASATLFVATGFLDGGCMWNDRVIEAVRHTQQDQLHLPDLCLEPIPTKSTVERRAAIAAMLRRLKYLPFGARESSVSQLVRAANVDTPRDLMLTREELRRWHRYGNHVGGHTVNHPILARLDDAAAREEISAGRDELEALLDTRVGLFAYPNGRPGEDYFPTHVDMVRDLGFDAAFSTTWGAAGRSSGPFDLPRFTPWDRDRFRFGVRLVHNLLRS